MLLLAAGSTSVLPAAICSPSCFLSGWRAMVSYKQRQIQGFMKKLALFIKGSFNTAPNDMATYTFKFEIVTFKKEEKKQILEELML